MFDVNLLFYNVFLKKYCGERAALTQITGSVSDNVKVCIVILHFAG